MTSVLRCGRYTLSLDRPRVMGIVNITPDSFSDGGRYDSIDAAVAHAQRLVDEGASVVALVRDWVTSIELACDHRPVFWLDL